MLPQDATRWCPHCRRRTDNAPLPQLAADGQLLTRLGPQDPEGFQRRYYCLDCRTIWPGIELPAEFVHDLLGQRQTIEDLHRQIAMLRFTLASQRRQESQGWPAALEIHSEPNEIAPADDDHQDHHDLDDQGSNNADRAAA